MGDIMKKLQKRLSSKDTYLAIIFINIIFIIIPLFEFIFSSFASFDTNKEFYIGCIPIFLLTLSSIINFLILFINNKISSVLLCIFNFGIIILLFNYSNLNIIKSVRVTLFLFIISIILLILKYSKPK